VARAGKPSRASDPPLPAIAGQIKWTTALREPGNLYRSCGPDNPVDKRNAELFNAAYVGPWLERESYASRTIVH